MIHESPGRSKARAIVRGKRQGKRELFAQGGVMSREYIVKQLAKYNYNAIKILRQLQGYDNCQENIEKQLKKITTAVIDKTLKKYFDDGEVKCRVNTRYYSSGVEFYIHPTDEEQILCLEVYLDHNVKTVYEKGDGYCKKVADKFSNLIIDITREVPWVQYLRVRADRSSRYVKRRDALRDTRSRVATKIDELGRDIIRYDTNEKLKVGNFVVKGLSIKDATLIAIVKATDHTLMLDPLHGYNKRQYKKTLIEEVVWSNERVRILTKEEIVEEKLEAE